jgi:hypothetical protein
MTDRRVGVAGRPAGPKRLAINRNYLRRGVQAAASDVRILGHRAERWGLPVPPAVAEAAAALEAWANSLRHPRG